MLVLTLVQEFVRPQLVLLLNDKDKLLKDTHNQTCDKYVDVIPRMFRFEKSVHMNTR